MTRALRYRSYAKINLYLEVLDRRSDGYHNIETLFQTVSLPDELLFEPGGQGVELTCSDPRLSVDATNLICRAAECVRARAGVTSGVRVSLTKNVPVAAGLAGGSGNAAATLRALNTLWELDWSGDQLHEVALALGSDVPYCLLGGRAAGTGRGEQLTALPPLPETWLVLVHPGIAVSTAWVYQHPLLPRGPAPEGSRFSTRFSHALMAMNGGNLPKELHNAMEVPVFHEYPELARVKQQLLDSGCRAAAMSGSGPTIFGVCDSLEEARSVADAMNKHPVSVVHTVNDGVERIE